MGAPSLRSALGRELNWKYPSNRFALLVGFVGFVSIGLAALTYGWDLWRAVAGGAGAFIAWAIGRELDPDHPATAGFAGVVVLVTSFLEPSVLLISVAFLVASRVVAGTVGASLSWVDVVVFPVWGYATGGAIWYWPVGVVILMWILFAPESGPRRFFGAATFVLGFAVSWYRAPIEPMALGEPDLVAAGIVVGVGILSIVRASALSDSDAGRPTLTVARVRLARLALAMCLAIAVAGAGVSVLWDLQPVAAALATTAVVSLFGPVFVRAAPSGSRDESELNSE